MKEQKYKENYISYADVVKQGRLALKISNLLVEIEDLTNRMSNLFDGDLPFAWLSVRSEIASRKFNADLKYKQMMENHLIQLENESK